MTDPVLDTSGPRPAVRLERHLPDPPAVVWRALTDREQLRRWFPCDVVVAGGRWLPGAALPRSSRPSGPRKDRRRGTRAPNRAAAG